MNTTTTSPGADPRRWLARGEAWLDERGRGAWIAAMVVGFIAFWPIGLALLAYMIWSKRMFSSSSAHHGTRRIGRHAGFATSSGNSAFDAYRNEMIRRLEDEQTAFEAFLQRLREAKDKSEFDAFMDERAHAAREMRADSGPDTWRDETADVASGTAAPQGMPAPGRTTQPGGSGAY